MKEQLEKIYTEAVADIEKATGIKDLDDIKNKYLSRKGELNEIKKGLKDLSVEDKKVVGSLANEISNKLETSISEKFKVFYQKELNEIYELSPMNVAAKYSYIGKTLLMSFLYVPIFPYWTQTTYEQPQYKYADVTCKQ